MEDLETNLETNIDEIELPEQKWFAPEEGLNLVEQLSIYIQKNPFAVKDASDVLTELQEYQAVLEQAKAVGARWNLQVDF